MEALTQTIGEVADDLKVTQLTVRRMWLRGLFPAPVQLGRCIRWRRSDVEKWLAEQPTSQLYKEQNNVEHRSFAGTQERIAEPGGGDR